MASKIWRYTLTAAEASLWAREDMAGWCKALQGCVEDEAREQGSKRYIICGRNGEVLVRNSVTRLPEPRGSAFGRDNSIY